jgi:hypothetical protein
MGFLFRKKWLPVVVLYAGLLAAFVLYPMTSVFIDVPIGNGSIAIPFVWLHLVAFVLLLSPLSRKAVQWIQTLKPTGLAAGVAILAFIGTMMQHLTGNLVFEVTLGEPIGGITLEGFRGIWSIAFFAYPVERAVLVLISVIIGVPLVRVLKQSLFAEKPTPIKP